MGLCMGKQFWLGSAGRNRIHMANGRQKKRIYISSKMLIIQELNTYGYVSLVIWSLLVSDVHCTG